jgi:hypothetical protein
MKTLVWLTAKAVIKLLNARAVELELESMRRSQQNETMTSFAMSKLALNTRQDIEALSAQLADFERDHLTSPKDRGKYFVAGHTKEV